MSEFYVVSFAQLDTDKIKNSDVCVVGVYDDIKKAIKARDEVDKFLKFAASLDYSDYDDRTLIIKQCKLNVENNYTSNYGIDEEYKEFLNKQYKNE